MTRETYSRCHHNQLQHTKLERVAKQGTIQYTTPAHQQWGRRKCDTIINRQLTDANRHRRSKLDGTKIISPHTKSPQKYVQTKTRPQQQQSHRRYKILSKYRKTNQRHEI